MFRYRVNRTYHHLAMEKILTGSYKGHHFDVHSSSFFSPVLTWTKGHSVTRFMINDGNAFKL